MTSVTTDWRRWFVGGTSAAVGVVALALFWRYVRNTRCHSVPTPEDDFVVTSGLRNGNLQSTAGRSKDTDVTATDLMLSRRGTGVYVDELTRALCVEQIKELLPVVGGKAPDGAANSAAKPRDEDDSAASSDSYVTDLDLETQIAFEMEAALREEILQIGPLVEAELRGGTSVSSGTTWRRPQKKTAKRHRNPVRKFLELALEYLEVNQERLRMSKRLREQTKQQDFHSKSDYASRAPEGNDRGVGGRSGYADYFEDDDDDDGGAVQHGDSERGRWEAQEHGEEEEEEWSDDEDDHEEAWEDDDAGMEDDDDMDDYADYERWLLQNGIEPDAADALTEDDVDDLIRAGFEKELLGHISTIRSVLLAGHSHEPAALDAAASSPGAGGEDDEGWITDDEEGDVVKRPKATKRAAQLDAVEKRGKKSATRGHHSMHA